jgi:uncharacterized protein (DUF1800 family)
MAVTWNLENAGHLLRRAAFGGTPEQIQQFHDDHTGDGVTGAVAELLSFSPSGKKPPGPKNVDDDGRRKMQQWWFKLMIKAKTPADACREKLVVFLHNHLASGANKQPTLKYMSFQNRRLRRFARGNFQALVREFNRDPANLYYLDGIYNVASTDGVHASPNENFGRELMELFTLGVFQLKADGSADPSKPNYTEDDVHNMARACSGWTGDIKGDTGIFIDGDWDGGRYDDNGDDVPDPMVIFGQSSNNFRMFTPGDAGASGPDDVLRLIFNRTDYEGKNQVGIFISKKLWTWYAYPAPAAGLKTVLNGFADVFAANNYELTPLLQAMWTHDAFYSDLAKSRTVRNPVDYIVQSFRAFGVHSNGKTIGDADRELGDHARIMGMDLFEPPNVAGWPGGLAWMNSSTLLARAEFAKELASADSGTNRIRLTNIPGLIGSPNADPAAVVGKIVTQLGLDQGPIALTTAQTNTLVAYANDNGAKPTLDLSDDSTDDATLKVRGVISLALQCAEHQTF